MTIPEGYSSTPPGVRVAGVLAGPLNAVKSGSGQGPFDLEVRSGEFISIVGPDGGGKSTLIRLIAGLTPALGGDIHIGAKKVESPQTDVSVVFSEPVLMEWRTALENVTLQAEIRGLDRNTAQQQARRLLVLLGVEGMEFCKPHEMPVPLQVRVALCRALLPDPSVLLMDDPFRSLDPLSREQMAIDLQRLMLAPRMTVILATSQIMEAVQLSDRVGLMAPNGQLVQYVTIELPRPRRLDKSTTPQIMEYCSTIRLALQAQGVLH